MRAEPVASVFTFRVAPVSRLRTMIVAFGTTAAVASATVTCKSPVICANREIAPRKTAGSRKDTLLNFVTMLNAPYEKWDFRDGQPHHARQDSCCMLRR